MTLARGALLVPVAFAAAAVAARFLMRGAPARVAADLAQPLVVATNWGAFGAALTAVAFAAIAVAAFGYRRTLAERRSPALPAIVAASALATIAAWWMPVIFSSDVYAYAAYGELARLGFDPYARAPLHAGDALLAAAAWQWGGAIPICVYGPAFVALAQAVVAALAPLGTLAALDGVRALGAVAFVLCAPLAYAAVPGDRALKLRAAATIALNPAAIWCAAEGHNDAIALAVVLAGFASVRRGLFGAGGAIVAFAAVVKPPAALAALALGIVQRRARFGVAIGIALAAVLSLPLVFGVVTQLAPHGRYAPQASLQAIFEPLGTPAALAASVVACAALVAGGTVRLRRGRADGWIWLGLAGWVLVPNPYPWYSIWLVALATAAPRTRAAGVALLLSFSSLLRYVPDAVGTPAAPISVGLGILATLPLLGLFGADA